MIRGSQRSLLTPEWRLCSDFPRSEPVPPSSLVCNDAEDHSLNLSMSWRARSEPQMRTRTATEEEAISRTSTFLCGGRGHAIRFDGKRGTGSGHLLPLHLLAVGRKHTDLAGGSPSILDQFRALLGWKVVRNEWGECLRVLEQGDHKGLNLGHARLVDQKLAKEQQRGKELAMSVSINGFFWYRKIVAKENSRSLQGICHSTAVPPLTWWRKTRTWRKGRTALLTWKDHQDSEGY